MLRLVLTHWSANFFYYINEQDHIMQNYLCEVDRMVNLYVIRIWYKYLILRLSNISCFLLRQHNCSLCFIFNSSSLRFVLEGETICNLKLSVLYVLLKDGLVARIKIWRYRNYFFQLLQKCLASILFYFLWDK